MIMISIQGSNKMQSSNYNNYGNVSPPNWKMIPHKGMQTPSKGELIQQIKELAAKRAEAVTDEDFAYVNHQEEKLHAQYLSSVSPDRKTLYKEAVQAIKHQKQCKENSEGEKTLIDYLNEHDNFVKRMKNGKPYPLPCGGSVTPIYNSRGSYDYDISIGETVVMSINQGYGQCTYTMTPAELRKQEDFNNIFDRSYNAAKAKNTIITNKNIDIKI